ncbi:MAG: hypothetical protein ACRELV_03350, partial [Longimicrobiales bacterium]
TCVVGALGVAIATSACTSSPATPPAAPPTAPSVPRAAAEPVTPISPAAARDTFVLTGLRPIGRTRGEIIDRAGRPDSVRVRAVPNRHVEGQIDTVATLYYPELRAELYVISGGRELLMSVLVRDDRWLASDRIRIGMPWRRVPELLGPPLDTQNGRPAYWCAGCLGAEDPVLFHVEDGVVRAVEFTYYVD